MVLIQINTCTDGIWNENNGMTWVMMMMMMMRWGAGRGWLRTRATLIESCWSKRIDRGADKVDEARVSKSTSDDLGPLFT